ncbi:MAG: TIGR02266 family protein [Candidatus Adiutricales bacterium]
MANTLFSSYNIATEEDYLDGDTIFEEGSAGDWIYAILSGEVEVYKIVGGKKVVIDILGPGDILGEVSFIDKNTRSASARAKGQTKLGIYDQDFLTREYNKLGGDFKTIFDYLARRLRKMTTVASNLAGRKTERVENMLEVVYETTEQFYRAYSTNIGGGGLFIKTRDLLPVETTVSLKFTLPDEKEPVQTAGKIIWLRETEEKGMGVQFVNLNSKDEIKINALLRKSSGE